MDLFITINRMIIRIYTYDHINHLWFCTFTLNWLIRLSYNILRLDRSHSIQQFVRNTSLPCLPLPTRQLLSRVWAVLWPVRQNPDSHGMDRGRASTRHAKVWVHRQFLQRQRYLLNWVFTFLLVQCTCTIIFHRSQK